MTQQGMHAATPILLAGKKRTLKYEEENNKNIQCYVPITFSSAILLEHHFNINWYVHRLLRTQIVAHTDCCAHRLLRT